MTTTSGHEPRNCPCKKIPLCLSSFTAAEYGDLASLAKQGAAIVHRRDQVTGYTPLHLAAQHGHVAATSLLLQLGCSVDAIMFHRTAFSGAVATFRLLIQKCSETNNNSGSGSSHTTIRQFLLAQDETFGDLRTPLHKAVAGGRYLAVQLLLDTFRENSMLQEGLDMKDSNQQTPLDVALQLSEIQEQEIQSVARWDQVAGGVADWFKCAELLKTARQPSRDKNYEMESKQKQQQMQVPEHLTRINRDGCIDCSDPSGKCLTASWQAAFQAALGNSVETTLLGGRNVDSADQSPHKTQHSSQNAPAPIEQKDAQTPATGSKPASKVSTAASKGGILCSSCGKPSIALYPAGGTGLVCRQCKRNGHQKV